MDIVGNITGVELLVAALWGATTLGMMAVVSRRRSEPPSPKLPGVNRKR